MQVLSGKGQAFLLWSLQAAGSYHSLWCIPYVLSRLCQQLLELVGSHWKARGLSPGKLIFVSEMLAWAPGQALLRAG